MLLPLSVQADDTSIIAKLAGQSMLLDAAYSEGLMTVVGERGHVLISSDGKQWQQIAVPTRTTLTGVYFHDKMKGWVVGHDAVILRTTDGGKDWQKVYDDPEGETPLFDVWFRDEKHGIAIGAYGLYLISEDGGASWDVSEMNVSLVKHADDSGNEEVKAEDDDDFLDSYDLHLNSIAIADNGKLYIAAEAG
ncbi:MAG: YCF48-related protein, partial [Gammaproteobacteria bacterium]